MNIWDPYSPIVYFLHTLLGTLGVVAAIAALSSRKGSSLHVRAGLIFTAFALIASATAMIFSVTRFAAFAIVSALIVIGLVVGAVLALRTPTRLVRAGEAVSTTLVALALLALLMMVALPLLDGAPIIVIGWPLAYAVFPAIVLSDDVRFLRADADARHARRFGRHLSRMAFALAIAVHAPMVSFGDALGIHPMVAFFGPLVLWPVLVLAFRAHPLVRARDSAAA